MRLQGRYMKTVFRSLTPYSLVHVDNRFQGNVGTATPDTNLTVTRTYGFRAEHMSVSSHGGIEGSRITAPFILNLDTYPATVPQGKNTGTD